MATEYLGTRTVDVFGDEIRIRWDGNNWVSPCNGQGHATAERAMRAELERYFRSCGEDPEAGEAADQIEGYLSKMS